MITINLPTVITFVTISYHISLSNGYSIGKTNRLSFDPDNFQCKEFIPLCNHALDIIGCLPGNSSNGNSDVSNIRGSVVNSLNHSSADHSNRLAIGCSNYPTEQNNLHDYVGLCICFEAVTIDISNTITKQIITNRIKPELKWILEPYKTGPPFDYDTSFLNICELLLPRLGCREEFIVSTSNSYSDNVINKKNICSCGNMTQSASVIHDLIVGEINEFTLTNLPIFSNPVYLSLPLSIVIILLCGKIGAIIVNYMQLPSIVGFLSAGIIIQNFIDPIILHGNKHISTYNNLYC